jgi:hypothetical protein
VPVTHELKSWHWLPPPLPELLEPLPLLLLAVPLAQQL